MKHQIGFTLIELMITVAVIAILSAVAYPSYTSYIQRGWRADARVVLLNNAQFMARFYSQNLAYVNSDGTAPTLPVVQAPTDGAAKYGIAVTAQAATSTVPAGFTLTATPSGWSDAKCGNLTINQLGVKGATATGAVASDCWAR